MLATQIQHLRAGLGSLQNRNNRLLAELLKLHVRLSCFGGLYLRAVLFKEARQD